MFSIKDVVHQTDRIIFLLVYNLGVNLGGLDTRVPKQFGDRIYVCT